MRFVTHELEDPMQHPKAVRRAYAQKREAVWQAFREHIEHIRPLLLPPLQLLLDANMHDAWLSKVEIDAEQHTISLLIRECDASPSAQDPFYDLHLTYTDIRLSVEQTALLCLIAREPSAEIYWDELEIVEGTPPRYIHRIAWNADIRIGQKADRFTTLCPEIELNFGGLKAVALPIPEGSSRGDGTEITVINDSEIATNTIYILG